MQELEAKLAELDREMQETTQRFRERMKQLRKTRRLAARALEQLKTIAH